MIAIQRKLIDAAVWIVTVICVGLIGFLVVQEMRRNPGSRNPGDTRDLPIERFDDLELASVAGSAVGGRAPYLLETEISITLEEPRGLATASGFVYVCGDSDILKLDKNGTIVSRYRFDGAPQCLDVLPDENIVIGFARHVEVFDQHTRLSVSWSDLGRQAIITAVRSDGGGEHIYVADAGNRQVLEFDRQGMLRAQFGTERADAFLIPSPYFDIAPDPEESGGLWIVDPGRHL